MSNLEHILTSAPMPVVADLPCIPWPALDHIDTLYVSGKRIWTFHYSDGTKFTTGDQEHAEQISRMFFPTGPKTNR